MVYLLFDNINNPPFAVASNMDNARRIGIQYARDNGLRHVFSINFEMNRVIDYAEADVKIIQCQSPRGDMRQQLPSRLPSIPPHREPINPSDIPVFGPIQAGTLPEGVGPIQAGGIPESVSRIQEMDSDPFDTPESRIGLHRHRKSKEMDKKGYKSDIFQPQPFTIDFGPSVRQTSLGQPEYVCCYPNDANSAPSEETANIMDGSNIFSNAMR
jgi:hypothetical protein